MLPQTARWLNCQGAGKEGESTQALPPSTEPIDISLFRSLSVSLRPVYCTWFQASSTGSLNSVKQLSSLIFASRQGRQIVFSANLSYSELKKLIRFSLELWFLSSSSCFLSCTCRAQHIHQDRNFQRLRLKFTWTNPLWQGVCIQAVCTTRIPFMAGGSVLCNTPPQSTSTEQLCFLHFKSVLSDLQICNAVYIITGSLVRRLTESK